MAKEEKNPARQPAQPERPEKSDSLKAFFNLQGDYARSLRQVEDDAQRRIEEALRECTDTLSKLEDDYRRKVEDAHTNYLTAERAAAATAGSSADMQPYRDYRRTVLDLESQIQQQAEEARRRYLKIWQEVSEETDKAQDKVHSDFLGRVQKAWRELNIDQLDRPTLRTLTQVACSFQVPGSF